jgi:uncharacterized protein (UPF0332 family)
MSTEEVYLYIERAHQDIRAARSNLDKEFYGIVVTRSYYAMFYAASGLLASQGIFRRRHSGVHAGFGEYFVKTGLIEVEYAKILTHAFETRQDADYDIVFIADKALAEEILSDAVRFVARIERYLGENGVL